MKANEDLFNEIFPDGISTDHQEGNENDPGNGDSSFRQIPMIISYGFTWKTLSIFSVISIAIPIFFYFFLISFPKEPQSNSKPVAKTICDDGEIDPEKHTEAVKCAIERNYEVLLEGTTLEPSMCGNNKIITAFDCNRLLQEKVFFIHFFPYLRYLSFSDRTKTNGSKDFT